MQQDSKASTFTNGLGSSQTFSSVYKPWPRSRKETPKVSFLLWWSKYLNGPRNLCRRARFNPTTGS